MLAWGDGPVAVDDGGLDDLAVREDAPRNRHHLALARHLELPALVHRRKLHAGAVRDRGPYGCEVCGRAEELDVGLLVHKAPGAAPAVDGVRRRGAVDARLAVDGEETVAREAGELALKADCLLVQPRAPWQTRLASLHVERKRLAEVSLRRQLRAPQPTTLFNVYRVQLTQVVVTQLAKRRAPIIPPPTCHKASQELI